MEDNNQNITQEQEQKEKLDSQETETKEEIKSAESALNRKDENLPVKIWLGLLTTVFSISMLSGLYIIFNGSAARVHTETVSSEKDEKKTAALLKIATREEGAAVVKIYGTIQETTNSGFSARQNASSISKRIRTLADKKEIKALLVDINSPGGTIGAVQDIYSSILYFRSKRKPVVALLRDVAASGGFYVAAAADKIIAQPGTITGSIGVIMQANNFEGLFEKIGIKFVPLKSGKYKDIGASYRPMTEEEIVLLQEMINDSYQQFYNAIKTARPHIDDAVLQIYADGRIFTGARAKALGLIDDLGGEEKAKEYLETMSGVKNIKLLAPRSNNFFDTFALSMSGMENKLGFMNSIEELSAPRVAYLWTY
ncbi:MAG: signal peptide peptidase SppA [Elusimicrobiota bacterium]|jgi:protease-4|nr:signal peptide peptidase SppA [Elusimicrobiota bacterium]